MEGYRCIFFYITFIIIPLCVFADDFKIDHKKVAQIKSTMKLEMKNDVAKRIVHHGEIKYLKNALDTLSIAELNKKELRILRNCIFARYGYIFKTDNLSKHFKQFKWYKAQQKDVKSQLNDIDKYNIAKIKAFENINITMKNVVKEKKLKGVWHFFPTMPSGWGRRFIFFNDKEFGFYYNQMRELPYIAFFSGTYKITGNRLKLFITKKQILKNEEDIEYTYGYGYQWIKPVYIDIAFNKPVIMVFPVSSIFRNDSEAMDLQQEVIKIGDIKYYKMGSNPEFGIQ